MSWPLFAALAGLAALALLATWLHYRFWVNRFTLELEYELHERLQTDDGSAIELRRLPAPSGDGASREGPPVLLVHGLALNHRNNDLSEDLSLGRHLARRGRDVWLLTLRCGRDDLGFREERRTSFEPMARHDLPLGVREVLRRTGAPALDYVGFSMGGMLLYASAGRFIDPRTLRRVVIIGSPARIQAPLALLSQLARLVPAWIVPTLRLRIASRLVAFMADWLDTPVHRWVYNPTNVDRGVAARSLVNGFVNIPSPLAAEFVRWSADGAAVRYEETPVTETLRRVGSSALFLAGAADKLAPPASVKLAYDAWGADVAGTTKRFQVIGIDEGAAADYGHGDLAIGRFVEQDVFEPVEAFLSMEDPPRAHTR